MIKILVIGIAGRMGKTIAECIEDTEGVRLGGGTEHAGSSIIGQDIGEVAGTGIKGISVADDPAIALETCDVVIDFTTPDSSMLTLNAAAKISKPLVVGTTGFSKKQKKEIADIGRKTCVVIAPNMSIGVNVLFNWWQRLRVFWVTITM